MSTAYWNQVRSAEMAVPTDRPLPDLTAELTTHARLDRSGRPRRDRLPDPGHLGLPKASTTTCSPGWATGWRRASSVVSASRAPTRCSGAASPRWCSPSASTRDNAESLLPPGKILEWGDRVSGWLVRERDVRGFVPGRGWAHAIAHGADALGVLADSPHLGPQRADGGARRARRPGARADPGPAARSGEPDRLARATMTVLRRRLVPLRIIEPWLARMAAAATAPHARRGATPT